MRLSISDKTCLTNFIPVPMRTIVMNKTDPFNLEKKNEIQQTILVLNSELHTSEPHRKQKPM